MTKETQAGALIVVEWLGGEGAKDPLWDALVRHCAHVVQQLTKHALPLVKLRLLHLKSRRKDEHMFAVVMHVKVGMYRSVL